MRKIYLSIFTSLFADSGTCQCCPKPMNIYASGWKQHMLPFNWTQDDDSNGAVKIDGTNQYANGYDVQIAKENR